MSTYTGACHCGQVTFEATLSPPGSEARSLILGGGAFTTNSVTAKSSLNITKGGDSLKECTYKGDSGKQVHCYYSPSCTTHIYHHAEVMGPDKVILRPILMDQGRKTFGAGIEMYGKDRMGWVKENATTFDVYPPS